MNGTDIIKQVVEEMLVEVLARIAALEASQPPAPVTAETPTPAKTNMVVTMPEPSAQE